MTLKLQRSAVSMIAFAALVQGATAKAQVGTPEAEPALSEDGGAIAEITVTAQKREQQINKVPMSITAASGDQLRSAGVMEVRDLGKVTPGFTFADSLIGSPVYTLRGIGFSDVALAGRPTVSVYVDQIPIPFAIETKGANLDIERVEVLKGPQGTLFGENSTGGAINFVAAKPTSDLEAGVDLSYGRFNAIEASGYLSGPLSESLHARISWLHRQADAWQLNHTRTDRLGAEDFTNGRLLLEWTPTDRLTVNLRADAYLDRSETQAAQLAGVSVQNPETAALVPGLLTAAIAPMTPRAANWDEGRDYRRHNRFVQLSGRIDYDLTDALSITSLSALTRYRHDQLSDFDGASIRNISWDQNGRINSFFQELRLSGEVGSRATVTFGLNYARDRSRDLNFVDQSQSTTSVAFLFLGEGLLTNYRQIANQRSKSRAIFGNLEYGLLDNVTISGGLRYTKSNIDFEGCAADSGDGNAAGLFGAFFNFQRALAGLAPIAAIPPGGCFTARADLTPVLAENSLDEDNLSWRANIQWEPGTSMLLYANLSRGYKAGGFPSLPGTAEPQFDAARQETVLAAEIGFKTSLFRRTMQLNGAFFRYDYGDKQILGSVLDPTFGSLVRLVNIPRSRLTGGEFQLVWAPVRQLSANIGGSYIDSRIRGSFPNTNQLGAPADFGGEAFPNTPKWQIAGGAEYRLPLGDRLEGFLGGNASYQSKTSSQLGRLAINDIPSYTLVDLRLGVESPDKAWKAWIWGRNIFNDHYWTASNKVADLVVRYAGRPATYGVSLSYRLR